MGSIPTPILAILITVGIALAGGIWALAAFAFKAGSSFGAMKTSLDHAVEELRERKRKDEANDERHEELTDDVRRVDTEHRVTQAKLEAHLSAHAHSAPPRA